MSTHSTLTLPTRDSAGAHSTVAQTTPSDESDPQPPLEHVRIEDTLAPYFTSPGTLPVVDWSPQRGALSAQRAIQMAQARHLAKARIDFARPDNEDVPSIIASLPRRGPARRVTITLDLQAEAYATDAVCPACRKAGSPLSQDARHSSTSSSPIADINISRASQSLIGIMDGPPGSWAWIHL